MFLVGFLFDVFEVGVEGEEVFELRLGFGPGVGGLVVAGGG